MDGTTLGKERPRLEELEPAGASCLIDFDLDVRQESRKASTISVTERGVGSQMVVEIPLTQGKVALVDDADSELISQYKWCAHKHGHTFYAKRGVQRNGGYPGALYMHTLITGFKITDHINGDGLDNRRKNLRRATKVTNGQNSRKARGNSKYKGVHWYGRKNKFMAYISVPSVSGGLGKRKHLGYFVDEAEAAKAYDTAARELYGEFAALNFPQLGERPAIERREYE